MKFRQDQDAQRKFYEVMTHIERNLENVQTEVASEFFNWMDRKAIYFRQAFERTGYGPQPDDLQRGDIVWVEFGINVGTELSDYATKGHYAIVWAVDLGNVVVIPLSSRPAPGSKLTYDIDVIEGLVQEGVNYKSYLKLDAIRSVSKRRIGRMPGKNGGKVSIDETLKNKICQYIQEAFGSPNS